MTNEQEVIKTKLGLLELAKQLGNVSQACKIMGYSRDSFYRFKELYSKGGEAALQEISRRKPILKNQVAPEVEAAVMELAVEQPTRGQVRASNELRKKGITISPAGVRCIWIRHDMPTMKERLKALEAKSPQEGQVLAEAQVVALAKLEKEAHGELESEHPGCCGAQDTFCVGTSWGCGPHLPADLHRHLRQGRLRQAPRSQDAPHCRRSSQRSRLAVLRGARRPAAAGADRPRHRVLRIPSSRVRALAVPWRTSTTPEPRPRAPRPTVSASAST